MAVQPSLLHPHGMPDACDDLPLCSQGYHLPSSPLQEDKMLEQVGFPSPSIYMLLADYPSKQQESSHAVFLQQLTRHLEGKGREGNRSEGTRT